MIYELRTYHATPGKLPALVKRFEQHTVQLFEKHGFKQMGYWTTAIGPSNNDFVYMLAWESLDDRTRRFAAFQSDPDWIKARNASEEQGPLVQSFSNVILAPTSFSAAK
jgi:heme-degrading monooxygenase HmoA